MSIVLRLAGLVTGMAAIAAAALLAAEAPAKADELVLPAGFASQPGSRDYTRLLQTVQRPSKPAPAVAGQRTATGPLGTHTGNDSCRWADDGECDEPGVGTGACAAGTDYSDCWRIITGLEDDSCRWANDGECDEPGIGTGACTQGTDRTDCGEMTGLRFRNDSCASAFDGICDEPEIGTGRCDARTDRADCAGRTRPLTINDHFFGHDDRVLMDTGVFPWSVVGRVRFETGSQCTASLVAPNVLATAAHCVSDDGRIRPAGLFETGDGLPGGTRTARVVDVLLDPEWDEAQFSAGDDLDGTDWALLRIDTPLGDELGYLHPLALVDSRGEARAREVQLSQAGYSWDTGDNLSGNEACRILAAADDNTMSHDCDTTRGDSGSPFMIQENGRWHVVAVDSNFRRNPDGPMIYIAARADRFAALVSEFAQGRIGQGGLRPRGPGKPGALEPVKSE